MIRFLRLFSSYRQLEIELRESAISRVKAEEEAARLRTECERLRKEISDAASLRAEKAERLSDWLAKRSGLGTIFNPLESIPDPPRPDMKPTNVAGVLASDFVTEMERKFYEDLEQFEKSEK